MRNIYDDPAFFLAYAQMGRSQLGLDGAGEWHQLKPMFPVLAGKTVLDLGCGYGWHCKYAAEQGAESVIGIDASEAMIAEARTRNPHPHIQYFVEDLLDYAYPENRFDCVVSNLVLHYVANLGDIYKKVFRTLRPGGVFLMNIEHPTFTAGVKQTWVCGENGRPVYWPIDNYYYPGARETSFLGHTIIKQHHTLTQILDDLLKAGFTLQTVQEAVPPKKMLDIPGMPDEMRRPMMLLVRAAK